MPKTKQENLYQRLTRLFRQGPNLSRKIKNVDYRAASSVLELFKKTHSNAYGDVMGSYGSYDRLGRLSDASEMEQTPEVFRALNVFADEAISPSEDGLCLHIYTENNRIRELLGELFYDTLNVEFNLRSWVRTLCKYGDFFSYIDVDPELGVVNSFPLPVNEISREEGYDPDNPLAFRFRWTPQGNQVLENWQVMHMRLLSNDAYLPYGTSVLDGARRIWRQLILIEDAMLTYRIVRSPDRRIFYIDIGAIPPEEVENYMEHAKAALKTNSVVNRDDGRIDLRNAPMAVTSDFFIPIRGAESATRIETLPGGVNATAIDDVTYIHNKFLAALGVPKAFVGFDDNISSKATLACLVGETIVPLADGRRLSIAELARLNSEGKLEANAFSYDHASGKITCGRIKRAVETKRVNQLAEVVLDNGEIVRCTIDHPFMLRDGSYRWSSLLKADDSLMPLYERISDKEKKQFITGYHQHLDVKTGKWVYTHRVFARTKYNLVEKNNVVHHMDFNKLNNDPKNLLLCENKAVHSAIHGAINRATKKYNGANNPRFNKEARFERLIEVANGCSSFKELLDESGYTIKITDRLFKSNSYTYRTFAEEHMPLVKNSLYRCGGYSTKTFTSVFRMITQHIESTENRMSISKKSLASAIGVEPSGNLIAASVRFAGYPGWLEFRNTVIRRLNKVEISAAIKTHGSALHAWNNQYHKNCSFSLFISSIRDMFGTVNKAREQAGIERYRGRPTNHKVISVRIIDLDESIPVYDLEIERFHNFAIGQGIFVHNSEEIMFSRSVQYIQRVAISELNKIAIVHLFCNGFDGEDLLDFDLRLPNPSAIAQQQKLELFRSKFEIAALASEGLLSKNHLRKNVFGMTDDEIELNELEIERDRLREIELEKISYGASAASGPDAAGEPLEAPGQEGGEPMALGAGGEEQGGAPAVGGELAPPAEPGGGESRAPGPRSGIGTAVSAPISPSPFVRKYKYNRGRIRHSGASKTHMTDFKTMMSPRRSPVNDPHGRYRTLVNPLADSSGIAADRREQLTELIQRSSALSEENMHDEDVDLDWIDNREDDDERLFNDVLNSVDDREDEGSES